MLTFEILTGCKWLQLNHEPIVRLTIEIWTGYRYITIWLWTDFKCLHLKFELVVNGYNQIMNKL